MSDRREWDDCFLPKDNPEDFVLVDQVLVDEGPNDQPKVHEGIFRAIKRRVLDICGWG